MYSEYSLMKATGQQHYSLNSLHFMITVLLLRLSALCMFLGCLFVCISEGFVKSVDQYKTLSVK